MASMSSMNGTSNNDIYHAIGSLTSEVASLRRDIQQADTRAMEGNRRADEHRSTIHRRVDEIVQEIGSIKNDMAGVKEDVADTKAVTEDVKKWKLMGMGALGVTGIAFAALGSLVTAYWSSIVGLLKGS